MQTMQRAAWRQIAKLCFAHKPVFELVYGSHIHTNLPIAFPSAARTERSGRALMTLRPQSGLRTELACPAISSPKNRFRAIPFLSILCRVLQSNSYVLEKLLRVGATLPLTLCKLPRRSN